MSGETYTCWADGFGVWRVRVDFPYPGYGPEYIDRSWARIRARARRCLRRELEARQGAPLGRVRLMVEVSDLNHMNQLRSVTLVELVRDGPVKSFQASVFAPGYGEIHTGHHKTCAQAWRGLAEHRAQEEDARERCEDLLCECNSDDYSQDWQVLDEYAHAARSKPQTFLGSVELPHVESVHHPDFCPYTYTVTRV